MGPSPTIYELDPYNTTSLRAHEIGQVGYDKYGDIYRYTRAATTATDYVAGKLLVSLAKESLHQNIALSVAAAVGAKVVKPTVGAMAVDANEYDAGILVFQDVSPEGEWYRITSHDASISGSEAIDVNLERPLKTVATTSSEVSLNRSQWNNPAISQLIAERAAGIPVIDWDVSVGNFGWVKTRGWAACLVDTQAITTGYKATISNSVDGAIGVLSDLDAEFEVGQVGPTGTATEYAPIYLTID